MTRSAIWVLCFALVLGGAAAAHAGAKLEINDNAYIDLGFRVQILALSTDRDIDGDGQFEGLEEFKLRRGRFRLKGVINDQVSIFMQTDVSGNSIRLIDAFITLKKDNWLQLIVGQNMAPANRQNLTSSGALLAADRPGMAYKSLTWGGRALSTFSTQTYGDTAAGFSGAYQVRDIGATVFGSGDVGENGHMKYYVGVYDGISAPGTDSERYSGRLQFNLGDAEAGYYNSATYLGKKETFAFGLSYDTQSNVAGSSTPVTDYTYWAADLFAEQPVGNGSFTVEASFMNLDLDDANLQAQGDGWYLQGGYLINNDKWQPWFLYEDFSADDPSGKGSYDLLRVGVSYFVQGHNANVKFAYEAFTADAPIGSSSEDSIDTLLIGFYTTY